MAIFEFIMTYNFDRPDEEIVCDLINIANGYKLYPAVVQFGVPQVFDPRRDVDEDINTYIPAVVDPSFDQRMVPDETGFLYTRVPLAALRLVENIKIVPPSLPFSTYDVLDQINVQLKTRLTEEDLENTEYTTLDDDFIIRAKPTSKVWIGERLLAVDGGGKKFLLFPNYFLSGFISPMDIRAAKTAELTEMANIANGTEWREVFDFEFDRMEGNIVGAAGRNTRIYVQAYVPDYIDQWIYYARLSPSKINDPFEGSTIPSVPVPNEAFTTYSILPKINEVLGIELTPDDVENTAYLPGSPQYQITFKMTSLGWLPGVYIMNAHLDTPDLQDARLVGDGSYRLRGEDVYAKYQ